MLCTLDAYPAQQFYSPVCLCIYETSLLQAFHGDKGAGVQAALLDALSQRIQVDNPQVLLKPAAGGTGNGTAWQCCSCSTPCGSAVSGLCSRCWCNRPLKPVASRGRHHRHSAPHRVICGQTHGLVNPRLPTRILRGVCPPSKPSLGLRPAGERYFPGCFLSGGKHGWVIRQGWGV